MARNDQAVRLLVVLKQLEASRQGLTLEQLADGTWSAQLKSPPADGKANQELIALIAQTLGCRRADVSIKSGASGRMKLVRIED